MARALLIAEKNSLCQTIKNAMATTTFPDEIDYATFAGHVVRQKEPGEYKEEWKKWNMSSLPIIPDKIQFVKDENKAGRYEDLVKTINSKHYDYIICATDAAREGNLIFAAFYDTIGCRIPVKRWFNNSLTNKDIIESMNNLLEWDTGRMKRLTDSAYLRSYFDSLSGWNFSRAYTLAKGLRKAVGLGRVMTPLTRIVVDRELEIRNFKPQKYYEVVGNFQKGSGEILATALDEDMKVLDFLKEKDLNEYLHSLDGQKAVVDKVDKKTKSKKADELFSLSSLQTAANAEFGYTLQQVLDTVQSLYEAKWISYPRTDSSHLTRTLADEFDIFLETCKSNPTYGSYVSQIKASDIKRVQGDKKYVDDKKVSDHYALIPTEIVPDYSVMTEIQRNVYDMIVRQFVSIFMPPLVTDATTLIIDVNGNKFRTKGEVIVDKGWTELHGMSSKDKVLPAVDEGDVLKVEGFTPIQKTTTPPSRYTDGSIISAMENASRLVDDKHVKEILKEVKGIGKPSTRTQILEKCLNVGLLQRKGKQIIPSDYSISIIEDLRGQDIISLTLTANWEEKLNQVENGTLSYDNFYQDMIKYITSETEKLSHLTGGIVMNENVIGTCPLCGKNVLATDKYYLCQNYKGRMDEDNPCGFVIGKDFFGTKINEANAKLIVSGKPTKDLKFKNKEGKTYTGQLVYDVNEKKLKRVFSGNSGGSSEVKKTGEKCPQCGHDMIVRHGKFGDFEACSNYPNCKYIKPGSNAQKPKETGEKCPNCGSPVVIKKGPYGEFKACSNYPQCKTIIR